ncbi:MAG: hypothetical protein A2X28_03760 [Elusimicrobia bacterium GWA2_56_46]|nr:MAG: hypothetical protein A2X28_03760 [Elusimicrobia bacterium GWA2_56_46]OGR54991.1 MAG: hypothetical protein A2X39_02695 [Elusimicrobia bacterium GWC2_56_31]HBB67775.1 hypothetical protein [Elusimicrobiota bacterium]HBW23999.1 hypothetical protein [Elusimicrobiota bacterium]
MNEGPKSRMRLRFARLEGAERMSHLEQIKAFRGIAAASGLDCWPAKAGSAVPKMAFGPALPGGYGSRCEYADLYLAQSCKEEVVRAKLSAVLPGSFSLLSARRVPVHFPSIEASVGAARYLIETKLDGEISRESLDAFLARESAPYEKTGPAGVSGTIDARPLVLSAELDAATGSLALTLRVLPGKNIKPEAALGVIAGKEVEIKRIIREELYWLDSKGGLEVI